MRKSATPFRTDTASNNRQHRCSTQKADLAGSVFFVEAVLHGSDKGGADNTGGDGEHGDADKTDEGAENAAYGSDRIDITVADRCECDDSPPHAVTGCAPFSTK